MELNFRAMGLIKCKDFVLYAEITLFNKSLFRKSDSKWLKLRLFMNSSWDNFILVVKYNRNTIIVTVSIEGLINHSQFDFMIILLWLISHVLWHEFNKGFPFISKL